jgi:cytosine permease
MNITKKSTITERLDAMYEFDREPVTNDKLQGVGNFLGMFAGEHVAGTEFVLGPLFVAHGVTAIDLFLGLLLGNILAVLSWTFLTAPIAVKTRLTLYWHLRKICGPHVTFVYGIVNAVMFCFLAGSMVAVSATAVGIPFDMSMPGLNDMYPTGVVWVIVVLILGGLFTALAILGFEKLAHFAKICSPWMALVFIACAIAVLPQLGVTNFGDFWRIANEKIWTGTPFPGQSKFTFWHVMFFAWFCNMAMHMGMADLSVFRYAKKWTYGLTTISGMFFGHYIAWICSGILCAAAVGNVTPGPIAYMGAGIAGCVCVVLAGWTTANPSLYRAGLALQIATPNWKRWKVTLIAGIITTLAALFPAIVMKLLDFVALYGLLLMPMGAILFADYWLFPKLGLKSNYVELKKLNYSIPAAAAWVVTLAISFIIPIEIFFKGLPAWFITILIYVTLSYIQQRMFAKTSEV